MKKRNLLFATIALLAMVAVAMALVPPPPVNQNIGINDSRFDKLGSSPDLPNQAGCRYCHSAGVPDRHHNLVATGKVNPVTGSAYGCNNCHPVVSGPNGQSVLIDRECLNCHKGLNFSKVNPNATAAKVNITRPHHINTAAAQNRECKTCHGSFVANSFDGHYVPSYAPSLVTPEPHYKIYNATSGRYWGGCYACHQNTTANVPELLDQYGTHHGAINGNRTGIDNQRAGTPGYDCSWCHTTYWNTTTNSYRPIGYPNELDFEIRNASSSTDWFNGTGCEKCHDVGTIHNIQYNYATTNGQKGYGHIGDNWDCNGCHAFWDAGSVSGFEGAMIPNVDSISPTRLTTSVATVVTIVGSDFLSGAGTYVAVVDIDGTRLTPSSVSDNQIVVTVPGLTAGVHTIQVVKTGDPAGDKVSKLGSLVAISPVTITSAKLKSGVITITGTGFGTKPTKDAQQYVTIAHGENIYYSQAITSWSNTLIKAKAGSTIASVGDIVTVTTAAGASTSATITK